MNTLFSAANCKLELATNQTAMVPKYFMVGSLVELTQCIDVDSVLFERTHKTLRHLIRMRCFDECNLLHLKQSEQQRQRSAAQGSPTVREDLLPTTDERPFGSRRGSARQSRGEGSRKSSVSQAARQPAGRPAS